MKRLALMFLCVVALVVAGACAPPPAEEAEVMVEEAPMHDAVADEAELTAMSDAWIEAFNAGDGSAIAAMMTEDGVIMPPNSEAVVGREAIAAFWQAVIDTGVTAALDMTELAVDGDLGFKRGAYEFFNADGESVDTGKWLEIWTRVDHEWQLNRTIWNSDLPLAEVDG